VTSDPVRGEPSEAKTLVLRNDPGFKGGDRNFHQAVRLVFVVVDNHVLLAVHEIDFHFLTFFVGRLIEEGDSLR